ncbi:hypothetical protein [Amycolatopsis sp. WQ 127309]|uniref:hypothetical protein n=1 Tax=Amycolatopsis sp. WQ 127309 TaxID=2932773 RepID=UPI001FF41517|nr:hypothetical protein [Amycolatopsis sp. WQ 127309]UOZ10526.1 hypothetical protein MUY22_20585 [Amycolatopsis sp. WQ 127309]
MRAGRVGGATKARNYRTLTSGNIPDFIKVERAHVELLRRQANAVEIYLNELEAGETP